MSIINSLYNETEFPHELYIKIKKHIEFNRAAVRKSITTFIEDLPIDLRTPLSIHIYREVYTRIEFLKNQEYRFISWICPILKQRVTAPDEYIFYEGDAVYDIYFVKTGACDYILPRYDSTPYYRTLKNSMFGFFDIVAALLDMTGHYENHASDDISCSEPDCNLSLASDDYQKILSFETDMELRRSFTARSYGQKPSELMTISKKDLYRMKMEFNNEFDDLFDGSVGLLHKIIGVKLYAMDACNQLLDDH